MLTTIERSGGADTPRSMTWKVLAPMPNQYTSLPMPERFWQKVNVAGPNDCWQWTAYRANPGRHKLGYGQFNNHGKIESAHRVAWELTFGSIPEGMKVCHSCDNPLCCNPNHLFLGTQSDNVRDMDTKGRRVSMPAFGERHGNARLTEDTVRFIHQSNESSAELARVLGVSRQSVSDVRNHKTWRHVARYPAE